MFKAAIIGGGLALAATQATAATVTLMPGGGQVVATDQLGLQGAFQGTDFVFEAQSQELLFPEAEGGPIADISTINDGPTGFTNFVQRLTISRSGGGTFDLTSLMIPKVLFGVIGTYTGTLPDGDEVEDDIDLLFGSVRLEGITAAGGTVATSFLPADSTEGDLGTNDDPAFGLDAFGPGFEDLVSLSFSVTQGEADFCDPLNLSRVDVRFGQSGPCAADTDGGPFTDVLFTPEAVNNDSYRYNLAAISLETDDMAPVPVPASLPLLLGGLGALALARRSSPRRRG